MKFIVLKNIQKWQATNKIQFQALTAAWTEPTIHAAILQRRDRQQHHRTGHELDVLHSQEDRLPHQELIIKLIHLT